MIISTGLGATGGGLFGVTLGYDTWIIFDYCFLDDLCGNNWSVIL